MDRDVTELRAGERFESRYQILDVLGRGGFAVVYSATDDAGRIVAIKVLKQAAEPDEARIAAARFRREVQIVAGLRDPHTVKLFDYGETAEGLSYLVFEHVPGQDLSTLLRSRGRLRTHEVLHILRQVLASLREAHQAGILHRDLKPENVRVYEYMGDPLTVKLLDFGIARETETGSPSVTATGELIGTPRYMSPEQLTQKPLTPASDLYSLGLLSMELLLGADALHGNRWADQIDRLRSGHVFALPGLDQVGSGLAAVLGRMTHLEPKDRLGSAVSVLAALDGLSRAPTPVPPTRTPSEQAAPTPHRTRLAWAAAAVVGVIIALSSVASSRRDHSPPPVPPDRTRAVSITTPTAAPLPKTEVRDVGVQPDAGLPLLPSGWTVAPEIDHDVAGGSAGCGNDNRLPIAGVPTYLPEGYHSRRKHPLVFVLHRDWETGPEIIRRTGFMEVADRDGVVLIAPEDSGPEWKGDDNYKVVERAYEQALEHLCIDPERVYAVGNGDAGRAIGFLTCESWITATATNSYNHDNVGFLCKGKRPPKPHIMISPKDSPRLMFHGGQNCPSGRPRQPIQAREDAWQQRNHCDEERIPDWRHRGGECWRWDCEEEFVTCHVDGGYGWAGAPAISLRDEYPGCPEPPTTSFPTSARIWDFLMSN